MSRKGSDRGGVSLKAYYILAPILESATLKGSSYDQIITWFITTATRTPKVCKIMAFWAIFNSFGPLFYILWGSSYGLVIISLDLQAGQPSSERRHCNESAGPPICCKLSLKNHNALCRCGAYCKLHACPKPHRALVGPRRERISLDLAALME